MLRGCRIVLFEVTDKELSTATVGHISLGLFHLNLRFNVIIEKSRHHVHLLNLPVIDACDSKDDAERRVSDSGGEYRIPIRLLLVASSYQAGFILLDVTGRVPLELELPHVADDLHGAHKGDEFPCLVGSERDILSLHCLAPQ